MDDMISRKAAVEYLMTNMGWHDEDGYEVDDADEKRTIIEDLINGIPSVPAVPLDKLCEWLERYATMDCDGCREAFGSCEDAENQEVSVCNSRERWKAMLTKWMEGLDADKET